MHAEGYGAAFDVGVMAISKYLNNIFSERELQPGATVSKMGITELIKS